MLVRYWAIKCGAAFALMYKPLAVKMYKILVSQCKCVHYEFVWPPVVDALCDLFTFYGIQMFEQSDDQRNESIVDDDKMAIAAAISCSYSMNWMLAKLDDLPDNINLCQSLVRGLAQMTLSGQYTERMVSALLLVYFRTQDKTGERSRTINHTLGEFLHELMERGQSNVLQCAFLPMMLSAVNAPSGRYDVPAITKTITKLLCPANENDKNNEHNALAISILTDMITDNGHDFEYCDALLAMLPGLSLGNGPELRALFRDLIRPLLHGTNAFNNRKHISLLQQLDTRIASGRLIRRGRQRSVVNANATSQLMAALEISDSDVSVVGSDIVESSDCDTGRESADEENIRHAIIAHGPALAAYPSPMSSMASVRYFYTRDRRIFCFIQYFLHVHFIRNRSLSGEADWSDRILHKSDEFPITIIFSFYYFLFLMSQIRHFIQLRRKRFTIRISSSQVDPNSPQFSQQSVVGKCCA